MRVSLLICLLAALAVLATAQFVYYMPIGSRTVYVGHAHLGETVYTHGSALEVVNLQSMSITFRGVNPGMVASPWLPNGAGVEYSYTRAAALFNTTEIDPRKDVECISTSYIPRIYGNVTTSQFSTRNHIGIPQIYGNACPLRLPMDCMFRLSPATALCWTSPV
jgi:hypothetical protein